MERAHKKLLIAGTILLLIFLVMLGYACYGEGEMRTRVNAPAGTDYGPIPIDLLRGRTHFERKDGNAIHSVNSGPQAEGRIAIARAAFGVGLVGIVLLVVRAFLKKKQKSVQP
jgi:hypothetical protein